MQGKQCKRYLKDISTNQNVWSILESLLKKKKNYWKEYTIHETIRNVNMEWIFG